jgi:hypothetical protein
LHLYNYEFEPLRTVLREALTVEHEVDKAQVKEGVEDTLGCFQQGEELLTRMTF